MRKLLLRIVWWLEKPQMWIQSVRNVLHDLAWKL